MQSDPQPRIAGDFDPTGCPAGLIVVMGTGDADVLQGSSASECFVGLAGNDVIVTGLGDDVVLAGEGLDRVVASSAATVLDAEDLAVDAR